MSEFKGNTGKWSYSQRLGEVKSSDCGILCFVLATGKEDFNGLLMAAAPELLEALQAVVRVADRATDEFDMARAAIKKALGQ